HYTEDALDVLAADGPFARYGIDAAISERGRHHRQVAAGHQNGALLEIKFNHWSRVTANHVEIAEHVADRSVSMAGLTLRTIYLLVQHKFAPGISSHHLQEPFEPE